MSHRKTSALADGYRYEADTANESEWCELLRQFGDSNINQTWAYAAIEGGERNLSTLKLIWNDKVVAIALARFRRLPLLGTGLAYVHRGPIWQPAGERADLENFRQVVRALRNEFVCKRRMTLRLNPAIFDDDSLGISTILAEEGFNNASGESGGKTILMDMTPSIDDLRAGMTSHWKRNLKAAEKNGLEIIEGEAEELFDRFIPIHQEMASRKNFVVNANPQQFRQVQSRLPEPLRMKVLLCMSAEGLCAGAIYSHLGTGASYMFGATSTIGKKSMGSYLLQWKTLQALKEKGISTYDLNGIDPVANHGTYQFKRGLAGKNGREVSLIGKYDARGGLVSYALIRLRDRMRIGRAKISKSQVKFSNALDVILSAARKIVSTGTGSGTVLDPK